MGVTQRPLQGIRVIALEQAVAVPYATRHLADLGADIIKIERPGSGDFSRSYDDLIGDTVSCHFVWLNRGKRSVELDVATPEGAATLEDLIAEADVFVHNLGPGAIERLGFGHERLRCAYPNLIITKLSGYGSDGPMADEKAFDLIVQAESGAVSITGDGEVFAKSGIPIADIAAGSSVLEAILAGLLARSRTGEGDYLETSLFDSMVEWMGYPFYHRLYGRTEPPRMGLAHPSVVPYDSYPTQDGTMMLIGVQSETGWASFATDVLSRPDLITDERSSSNGARVRNREVLDDIISETTRKLDAEELAVRLRRAGIAHGRVNTVGEALQHPQIIDRERWTNVGSPEGDIKALVPPIVSSSWKPRMASIPALGEHTDEVRNELRNSTRKGS